MTDPLVSVLIPCYNAERWIRDALTSVVNQTWANLETIVVDDGSSDRSAELVNRLQGPNLRLIRQENKGASAARNRAYQESRGEFIQWLDADDVLAPDKIERQMRRLQSEPRDVVASGEWARFRHEPEEARFTPEVLYKDLKPVDYLVEAWTTGSMMQPGAWLVPRSVAERAGAWNTSFVLNDDGEYFTRVVLASDGIAFCPGARVYYRSGNPDSLGSRSSRADMESWITSVGHATRALLKRENSPRTRDAAASNYQQFIFFAYLQPDLRDLVDRAQIKVEQLGGASIRPGGGSVFQGIVRVLGWERAFRWRAGWNSIFKQP